MDANNVTTTVNGTATFVTGYRYIGLNTTNWYAACNAIAMMNIDPVTGNTTVTCNHTESSLPFATGNCSDFASNWQFSMRFSTDAIFSMSGRNFTTEEYDDVNLCDICYWNLQDIGEEVGGLNQVLVGEQFFKQFYTVFDSENASVGIGISNNVNTTDVDGPWITFWTAPPAPEPTPTPTPEPEPNGPTVLMVAGITTGSVVIVAVAAFFGLSACKAAKARRADAIAHGQ
jgi:hypothetical protein